MASNTGLTINPVFKRSIYPSRPSQMNNTPFLGPDDVNWSEIPPAKVVYLFWDAKQIPAWAFGATFGLGYYGGTRCSVISIPYNIVNQNVLMYWTPTEGFLSRFEAFISHEFTHALDNWAGYYDFPFRVSEGTPPIINCAGFNNNAECYAVIQGQVDNEFRNLLDPAPPVKYTLSVATGLNGSVSPAGGLYDAGSEVILTAIPDPGYSFQGWSDDGYGSDNPFTVIMNRDMHITASFFPTPAPVQTPGLDIGAMIAIGMTVTAIGVAAGVMAKR